MDTKATELEEVIGKRLGAPDGETPRYSANASLTYLDPEGWFVIWGNEVHPYGEKYADALAAWERVANRSPYAGAAR